jgi:DNA repair photolyase
MPLPRGLRVVSNPPNPWLSTAVEYLPGGSCDAEPGSEAGAPVARVVVIEDATRSILAENDSPDLGFRWSLNPYRGCFHACAYCYARPDHQYLGLGAGTDFDRKLVVKPRAAELLVETFERPSWQGELVMFSGDTDCYQPLEASYELTRRCLEVCARYHNPCALITKSPLVERDVDLLAALSRDVGLRVTVSIPLWDVEHARALEPFVATPQRRIRTIERLSAAGVTVGVNIAPLIPGLGEDGMPAILRAAREAGARYAGFVFLRLPGPVAGVFEERLRSALPLRAEKVLARVREARKGKLHDARFGTRLSGEGPYARTVRALFDAETKRLGLDTDFPFRPAAPTFRRPPRAPAAGDQLRLF